MHLPFTRFQLFAHGLILEGPVWFRGRLHVPFTLLMPLGHLQIQRAGKVFNMMSLPPTHFGFGATGVEEPGVNEPGLAQ